MGRGVLWWMCVVLWLCEGLIRLACESVKEAMLLFCTKTCSRVLRVHLLIYYTASRSRAQLCLNRCDQTHHV